jgi:hypothetical protein
MRNRKYLVSATITVAFELVVAAGIGGFGVVLLANAAWPADKSLALFCLSIDLVGDGLAVNVFTSRYDLFFISQSNSNESG